jgi:hypothetical protein
MILEPPGRPYGLKPEAGRILDKIGATKMPELGGKKLAGEFGGLLAGVRKLVDEAKLGIAAAITELTSEIQSGKEVERAIRAEAQVVRDAFAEVLGNSPPAAAEQSPSPPHPLNGGPG